MLRLFPGIRIIEAHGRMHRNGAEENVAAFAEGNYDVLLATTVIENGVDIPSGACFCTATGFSSRFPPLSDLLAERYP